MLFEKLVGLVLLDFCCAPTFAVTALPVLLKVVHRLRGFKADAYGWDVETFGCAQGDRVVVIPSAVEGAHAGCLSGVLPSIDDCTRSRNSRSATEIMAKSGDGP